MFNSILDYVVVVNVTGNGDSRRKTPLQLIYSVILSDETHAQISLPSSVTSEEL